MLDNGCSMTVEVLLPKTPPLRIVSSSMQGFEALKVYSLSSLLYFGKENFLLNCLQAVTGNKM